MEINKFKVSGPIEIIPNIYTDSRGSFHESYSYESYKEIGINANFVQDNHSSSIKNVLRGIHLQKKPHEQGKLVRVVSGRALDIAVDLRPNSVSYKHYVSIILEANKNQFWIPRGFGHAFLSLEDNTHFLYKTDNFYNKESELTLKWDDPEINIDWGINNPIISEKDAEGLSLKELQSIIQN